MHTTRGSAPSGSRTSEGKLSFRNAEPQESGLLKGIYESSWGGGITIRREQLEAQMAAFPEGQIVGVEKESGRTVSMINIMVAAYSPDQGFTAGYERVSGGRTFSTHQSPEGVLRRRAAGEDVIPVALCMSIAVHPDFMRNGFAYETLNHAIRFAERNSLAAVPYSAPRGLGAARRENPSLALHDYLHLTRPSGSTYAAHLARLERMLSVPRMIRPYLMSGGRHGLFTASKGLFERCQAMGEDTFRTRGGQTAFDRFLEAEGQALEDIFGRPVTIEDFCIIGGRKHADPTMRMHIENGARFIRREGRITAAFEGSRPEDRAADGCNVVLSYAYDAAFGR